MAAFDELYRLMHERIYRFALRLTGHKQDAEDIAVQTFIEAFGSHSSFLGVCRIETWMYRIAVHTANRARRTRRHLPMPAEEIVDLNATSQVDAVELQQLLLALPDHLRASFLLVKVEGLTNREAAEVLGKRQGTVQSQVFQASRLLRAQLLYDPPLVKCDQPERCIL